MKCGALIRQVPLLDKGGKPRIKKNGEPRKKRTDIFSRYHQEFHGDDLWNGKALYPFDGKPIDKSEFTECDGEIKIEIEEGYSCDCGYMSESFSINYECKTCKNMNFPELPGSLDELEEFLQNYVNNISEVKREKSLAETIRINKMTFEERLEYLKSKNS